MQEIFDYSFYSSSVINLTVGNILLLIVIILSTRLLMKLYSRFIHKQARAFDAFDKEKEAILLRVGRSVILISAVITAISSLGLYKLLELVMAYELFNVQKVKITIGKVIIFVLIIIFARILSRLVRIVLRKNFSRKAWIDEGKEYTIYKLTKYGLYGFALLLGLTSIGIDMKLILGATGALLVGIGFGLQHLFYDLVAGFVILFEGPVKVGDVIEVNGLVARVQQIDIRTSKVLTRDGKYIIIPNSNLVGEKVVNWSHGSELTRFNIDTRVRFGSDTAMVKELLYNCALRHPDVSKNREIIVRFEDFGENALHFSVFFWARKTWVVETLQSEIRFEIDKEFRSRGIQVPFPQREIHLHDRGDRPDDRGDSAVMFPQKP
jgi:small-conductance mechanosensitive channel